MDTPTFLAIFMPVLFVGILIVAITLSVKYEKERKQFISSHKIKCKRCGTTETVFISMVSESYSTGYNGKSTTHRSTVHYGHDKFCCNKCKSNHFIENGDWVDGEGNICNEEAKRLRLYR